jgi:hypothetical protein
MAYDSRERVRVPINEAIKNYNEMISLALENNAQVLVFLNPTISKKLYKQRNFYNRKIF